MKANEVMGVAVQAMPLVAHVGRLVAGWREETLRRESVRTALRMAEKYANPPTIVQICRGRVSCSQFRAAASLILAVGGKDHADRIKDLR